MPLFLMLAARTGSKRENNGGSKRKGRQEHAESVAHHRDVIVGL